MRKMLFVGFLFVVSAFAGCSSDDMDVASLEEKIENNLLPVELKDKADMPEWLIEYINEFESYDAPTQVDEAIYQFSWRSQTMYFHNIAYSPTFIDRVFYADGTRVDWNLVDREDIVKNSKDWKLIYKIIRKD